MIMAHDETQTNDTSEILVWHKETFGIKKSLGFVKPEKLREYVSAKHDDLYKEGWILAVEDGDRNKYVTSWDSIRVHEVEADINEPLRKLSPGVFDEDGKLKPFGEQLFLLEHGEFKRDDILIASPDLELPFDIENKRLPLVVTQVVARKIIDKHDISPKDFIKLTDYLKHAPLARDGKFNNFIVILSKTNKPVSLTEFTNNPENLANYVNWSDKRDIKQAQKMLRDIRGRSENEFLEHPLTNALLKHSSTRDLIAVLSVDENGKCITVNEMRSSYYDDIKRQLTNALSHEQNIYVNEHTREWLDTKLEFAPPGTSSHSTLTIPQLLHECNQNGLLVENTDSQGRVKKPSTIEALGETTDFYNESFDTTSMTDVASENTTQNTTMQQSIERSR
jgi:hypothetical protein